MVPLQADPKQPSIADRVSAAAQEEDDDEGKRRGHGECLSPCGHTPQEFRTGYSSETKESTGWSGKCTYFKRQDGARREQDDISGDCLLNRSGVLKFESADMPAPDNAFIMHDGTTDEAREQGEVKMADFGKASGELVKDTIRGLNHRKLAPR
jgi:hypothetical protein